ncbi:deaminase [Lithospermum erythrorhizon]|uniref:Deaminase n=1 Tax=Lithospermum erythrorhizon TaxID=34254 RepID=A0AAV3Q0E1_LITER
MHLLTIFFSLLLALIDNDPGLTGNLLVERLVGAHIDLVSKEEYSQVGSMALTNILKEKLISEGRKPYVILVGESNSLGTWGYIEAIREIEQQVQIRKGETEFDDIVVVCGSGGTIAGLAIGSWLSSLKAKVTAYCVCDDPRYFYDYAQDLLDGIQANVNSRDIVNIVNIFTIGYMTFLWRSQFYHGRYLQSDIYDFSLAKGLGYAMNTSEELQFVKQVVEATGVILDPVYRYD